MESTSREHKVTNHQPTDPATDELSRLRAKLNRIMQGLEGTCMTCEPVGVRNQQMERDIETLKAERDLLRREVCRHRAADIQGKKPKDIAAELKWDCFLALDRLAKEDANAR